jgi:hypothetical protein
MSNAINGSVIDTFLQLATITWDGNLISKTDRDYLVQTGYAKKVNGWNYLTTNGIIALVNLRLIKA